jgi:hypothetical protein
VLTKISQRLDRAKLLGFEAPGARTGGAMVGDKFRSQRGPNPPPPPPNATPDFD